MGGRFRETLDADANKAELPLNIAVSCSSFTQAARLVQSGDYGGVLPAIARIDLDPSKFQEVPLPSLKEHTRNLRLAWNPRLVEVRPFVLEAIDALK